eukprot:scaffold5887_cov108-Isochrysis_galbana.AAC.2
MAPDGGCGLWAPTKCGGMHRHGASAHGMAARGSSESNTLRQGGRLSSSLQLVALKFRLCLSFRIVHSRHGGRVPRLRLAR